MSGLSRETLGLLLGALGVFIFGLTLPATRLAVSGLDPWFLTAGRAAVAGVLALALLLAMRRRWPSPRQWRSLVLIALFLVAGFPGFTGVAMQSVPAAHGGVVLGVMPLMTAVAASIILHERPSLRFWLLAVLGAALVVGFALRDGGGSLSRGDVFLFAAGICAPIGYVFSGQLAREMPGWEVISWALVLSMPITVPFTWLLFPAAPLAVPAAAWGGFAYIALFSMFLGFFAWNSGLAMGGVARVSQVQLLQTFVTVGGSAVINGETVSLWTWAAAVLVVIVVALGRRAKIG